MTVNINKPQINLREQLKKLERPTTDKLAVKGHDGVLLDPLTGELSLQAIDLVVGGVAVDVFVYDTSKDSDGGAWRKRTQSTSWYNETLNTSTRGSRKEFPAVAVIVADASADKVTIYDGDDPDLPMWMVCSAQNPRGIIGWATNSTTDMSLAAMNGIMVVGTNDSGTIFKFIEDYVDIMYSSANYFITSSRMIAGRNDTVAYTAITGGAVRVFVIATYDINDVAMTVLPNAPIDPSTGLPTPTIAVATESGVSVVRDDGNVVDLTQNSPYTVTNNVFFSDYGKLLYDTEDTSVVYEVDIPSSDTGYGVYNSTSNGRVVYPTGTHAGFSSGEIRLLGRNMGDGGKLITKGAFAFDANGASEVINGLTLFDREESDPAFNSLLAFVASDYNTGWMHGDVKGAFLSDTDPLGEELIVNGTFGSNIDNWRSFNSVLTHATDSIRVGDGPGSWSKAYQSFTTVVGKKYQVRIVVKTISGQSATASVGAQNPAKLSGNDTTIINSQTSTGTYYGYFTATATTSYVEMASDGTNYVDYSEVSVRNAVCDRSVGNNHLRQYGTITKTPVATGAELVGYGPFNNSNNFRQPYNSDLNFEQNDFSIMFWIYDTGVNQHCTLISRDEREFDISRLAAAYGNKLRIYTRNSSEDLRSPDSASALPFNTWTCVCVTYTGGNTKNVYLNGKLDRTITGTDGEYDIDSTSYGLNIGVRYTGGTTNYSADGVQLALMRISGSAPSPEQVKKMYDDEKCLFQENAKATLYGSSDAVTALAYDSTTSLLHVGTSGGRSTFSGLKRVENTTTAVATAISASNGLVAEQ